MSRFIIPLFFILSAAKALGQEASVDICSPDGQLCVSVSLTLPNIHYSVVRGEETVLRESLLGMVFSGGDTLRFVGLTGMDSAFADDVWEPRWGTTSRIRDRYREQTLRFRCEGAVSVCHLQVRVYDDGCAFRYVFPDSSGEKSLLHELSEFNFSEDAMCWWAWADYNTLEKKYERSPLSRTSHVALPFTLQLQSGTCISIHEAAVDDFTTMTLRRSGNDSLSFRANLLPWSDGVAVRTASPFRTPWRTIFITADPAALLSSDLLWNLNTPCKFEDLSWIKPIRFIGIWWDMHLGLATWKPEGGRHGATTARAKRYIDFASRHGIEGVLVEGWNTGWERWGKQDAFDFTTPSPDFDLPEVARYARMKGVELVGHHETGGDIIAYESRMDSAFALYRRLGIRYLKTGYAGPVNPPEENHHGQYMVRHVNLVMRKAAEYGLMLDVHEPVVPTGLGRTYPNLMTFEGFRGSEWNAWSEGNPPSHTCTLPFTRGMAGPMDYTPGILDTRLDDSANDRVKWNGEHKGPTAMHSTVANQLALSVVNYSPMQMAADRLETYERHPLFGFIEQLPARYDESRVLAAAIGEYIVVARRKGAVWYVAGINNEQARELQLPADFLDAGSRWRFEACFDAPSSHFEDEPESYSAQAGMFDPSRQIDWSMAPGGGGLMILREE
ncbi:MAG: hypothetical protein RL213_354 [Bacteroidota bacterium]|jgi:alpha-glucosidase